jgi:hypothetical protein
MSTRSTIAIINVLGQTEAVYSHYDGYESGIGSELLVHFNTEEKILNLIQGGAVRTINDGVVEYFGDDEPSKTYEDYDEFLEKEGQEYNYLWLDGRWIYEGGELREELEEMIA